MKTTGHIVLAVLVLMGGAIYNGAIAEEYTYQQKDQAAENKKYIEKLTQDKIKVNLAVENTKALIDVSRNKPYLPELYLRLAELYVEQSRVAYFLRRQESGLSGSAFDQLESNTLKNQALEIYQRILDDFPDFEDRDKVHFFMAHEFRELGKIDDMVKQYREIIKSYKQSPYVPESYLLLGDYFISKKDLDLATRHYESVLNYPDSSAIAIARYKLAWCHINKAEFKKAIQLFEDAVTSIEVGKELDIDTYKRVDIKLESLMDMAFCYNEVYKKAKPEDALTYFRKYAWSRQVYTAVLEKLAYRYYLKKKWHHAAEVYRTLSNLQQDPEKLLEYARNIFECVQALGHFENADQDMAIIVKALKKEKYAFQIPDADKKKDLKDYELYARNIATHLHNKAREKKSVKDYEIASNAYEQYLDFFTESPVRKEMENNYAEALFSSEQYLKSGEMYEKLASDVTLPADDREKKLYGAVISYYTALKGKDTLNYYQIAFARDGLRTTGKSYAADFPKSNKVPDVLFNVAWIAYDAGKYDDAIAEFKQFVKAYPSGKPAKAAVHLILDSYHLKEDQEGLIKFGKSVLVSKTITDSKLKAEVAGIVNAAESKIVSSLTLAALDDWDKGKSDLMKFASKSSSAMGEQALGALVVSSKEKGDLETLLTAGTDFVRQFPKSKKTPDVMGLLIESTMKAAQFRIAADNLEKFAHGVSGQGKQQALWHQAGQIREVLGQYQRSNQDYGQALKLATAKGRKPDEIVIAMANNAEQSGQTAAIMKIFRENRAKMSPMGRIQADAEMARLYQASGKSKYANKHYRLATRAYKPAMGEKYPELREAVARMMYSHTQRAYDRYMHLKLGKQINNTIVGNKSKLLAQLEKGYQQTMQYKSPKWALIACFRAYEINAEFGQFLKNSPVPSDLTAEQKSQYVQILAQKAQGYLDKAEQYRQTCVNQARKWVVCDPEMAAYAQLAMSSGKGSDRFPSFSSVAASTEIGWEGLKDATLKKLHEEVYKNPDNSQLLSKLADAYIKRADFRQAILVSQKALNDMKNGTAGLRAKFNNQLGISYLFIGDDASAKEAFQKALEADPTQVGACINLAGLYQHYGHNGKAEEMYHRFSDVKQISDSEDLIHSHAKELFYAYFEAAKQKVAKAE